jgi:hypothetical protein
MWRNTSAAAAAVAVACLSLTLARDETIGSGLPLIVTGVVAAAVAAVTGYPAVRGYRYALWWVIPMGLVTLLCVCGLVAAVGFARSDAKIGWPDTWGR